MNNQQYLEREARIAKLREELETKKVRKVLCFSIFECCITFFQTLEANLKRQLAETTRRHRIEQADKRKTQRVNQRNWKVRKLLYTLNNRYTTYDFS